MREVLIRNLILMIQNNHTYTDLELEKIRYGLEGIYLTITKLIAIFALAFILGIIKETTLLLLAFNIIRYFGFGVHAKTSMQCLISSIILFILLPFTLYKIKFNLIIEVIIFVLCFINLLLFAPSDSKERRFSSRKKYFIRKAITLIIASIYILLYYYLDNFNIIFMISLIIQSIVVNPLMYKIMGIKYNYNLLRIK